MLMLRFGLFLLLASSVGVTLRSMEWTYLMGHMAKVLCSLALTASIMCFLATYFSSEFTHHRVRHTK